MSPDPSPVEAFMELLENCKPMIEGVAGYREACRQQGFNETASEQMAVEFHRFMLQSMLGQRLGQ